MPRTPSRARPSITLCAECRHCDRWRRRRCARGETRAPPRPPSRRSASPPASTRDREKAAAPGIAPKNSALAKPSFGLLREQAAPRLAFFAPRICAAVSATVLPPVRAIRIFHYKTGQDQKSGVRNQIVIRSLIPDSWLLTPDPKPLASIESTCFRVLDAVEKFFGIAGVEVQPADNADQAALIARRFGRAAIRRR